MMSSPSISSFNVTSSWSIPISPNSFSMTAMRRACSSDERIRFRSVVFPEPKKPVMMVAGTRGSTNSSSAYSAAKACNGKGLRRIRPLRDGVRPEDVAFFSQHGLLASSIDCGLLLR